MRTIASYSIKGGVGKTTAAANLAWLAAAEGRRVLLWDLDPQGGATYLFRIKPKVKGGSDALVHGKRDLVDAVKASDYELLDLMPADFSYRNLDLLLDEQKRPTRQLGQMLKGIRKEYDLVVLDCAPSVSLVSENVLRAADLVLAPLLPAPLSLRTLEQLRGFVDGAKGPQPQLLPFLSMVDRRRKLHREMVEQLPQEDPAISSTVIPIASAVEQMSVRRDPIVAWAPSSPAAQAFGDLWTEATDRLGAGR